MKEEIKPEELPSKSDFIKWWNSVLSIAEIIDRRYPVKGTFVWLPYGLKIMKNLVKEWEKLFEENGIQEVYFPLFVPLEFAKKNEEWFEGFKEDLYLAHPYTNENEKYVIRPTGEPAMYPIFALWIKEGKLPIKIFQTVSSFRHEGKTTHSMIRDREITFWYEIHTAHRTKEEAEEEFNKHLKINDEIWEKILCIKPIKAEKPKYLVFPGAEGAIEYYTILPDGRLLENGSVNNLGQAYAKKFDLYWIDEKGEKHYCWQICTGNGARYLVAAFSIHSDERGLIIPPKIAPIQVIIIPIFKKENREKILNEAKKIKDVLINHQIKAEIDEREEITPGEKFFIWEIKGVPIRIEIGEEEVNKNFYTIFRRDKKERYKIEKEKVVGFVKNLLEIEIPKYLFENSIKFMQEKIQFANNIDETMEIIKNGKVAKVNWCGSKKCYEDISLIEKGIEAIGFLLEQKEGKCIICGSKTNRLTLIGRVY